MNEYEIIDLLTERRGDFPADTPLSGTTSRSFRARPGKLVLKSDMLVGRTDVPPGMTWRQAGRKAVAMCVSDFASKGVSPQALMVSLGIPRNLRSRTSVRLVRGFQDGMAEWGLHLSAVTRTRPTT